MLFMPVEAVFGGTALGFALYWHGRLLPRTIDGPPSLRSTLSAHPPSAAFTTGLISTGIVLSHVMPTAFFPLPFLRIPVSRLVVAAILVSAGATFANACRIPHLCPYGRPFYVRLVALAAVAAVVTATLFASSRFFNPHADALLAALPTTTTTTTSAAVVLPRDQPEPVQAGQAVRDDNFQHGFLVRGGEQQRDMSYTRVGREVYHQSASGDGVTSVSISQPISQPCEHQRSLCDYHHSHAPRRHHQQQQQVEPQQLRRRHHHLQFYYHFGYRRYRHHRNGYHQPHRKRFPEPVYILLVGALILSVSVPPLLARIRAPPPPPLLQEMLGYTLGVSTGFALVSADALDPSKVVSALDMEAEKWDGSFLLCMIAAAIVVVALRPNDDINVHGEDINEASILKLPDPLDILHPPCTGCVRGVVGAILFGAGCGTAGISPCSALIYFGAFPTHLHSVAVVVSMLATTALCSLAIAAFEDAPPDGVM